MPSAIRIAALIHASVLPSGLGIVVFVRCLITEVVLTFMFLLIIMGATDGRAPAGFGPIAIGLGLTLIHLIGIPVTNLSVNPARSTGPAVFLGDWALAQLWLFWVTPVVGGVLAGHASVANHPPAVALPMGSSEAMIDRLRLDTKRIAAMAAGLRDVAGLADPVGEVVRGSTLANGLELRQLRAAAPDLDAVHGASAGLAQAAYRAAQSSRRGGT